jgi:hypothetical protein
VIVFTASLKWHIAVGCPQYEAIGVFSNSTAVLKCISVFVEESSGESAPREMVFPPVETEVKTMPFMEQTLRKSILYEYEEMLEGEDR